MKSYFTATHIYTLTRSQERDPTSQLKKAMTPPSGRRHQSVQCLVVTAVCLPARLRAIERVSVFTSILCLAVGARARRSPPDLGETFSLPSEIRIDKRRRVRVSARPNASWQRYRNLER